MRNPNGYGSVAKLSGKRRNPFVVRKTVGFNEKGHPIYINIGYAPTREAGLIMLAEYNKNPWDIDADKMTLDELYRLWVEKKAPKLGNANRKGLCCAYRNHCKKMGTMQYNQIKSYHMQECIDSCGRGYSTQSQIKNLWGHLDRFAMELDIISKCYSDLLTSEPIPETSKSVFTDEEIQRVWDNQQLLWVDSVLFLLYTGFRISEMLDLKLENIDLQQSIMVGGTKTAAGRNRVIPIHSKIYTIVKARANLSQNGYLFELDGRPISYHQYQSLWVALMKQLKMKHTPHECRHTFRSRLDSAGANKVCIDRLMGHKSAGTGERVYTHKNIEELRFNIELVT